MYRENIYIERENIKYIQNIKYINIYIKYIYSVKEACIQYYTCLFYRIVTLYLGPFYVPHESHGIWQMEGIHQGLNE